MFTPAIESYLAVLRQFQTSIEYNADDAAQMEILEKLNDLWWNLLPEEMDLVEIEVDKNVPAGNKTEFVLNNVVI